jgi:hypothetical protein
MVEGDLTIPLFLAGTGVTIIVAGISQAGWRHHLLIRGLFAVGAILVLAGVCWRLIGDHLPAVTTAVSGIATSPVAWFVVVLFALAVVLTRKPQNQAAIPIMRPIIRPAATPQQQPPPIEIEVESEIEQWWRDHFHGSEVARHTPALNVAYAAKEDLKRRLRASRAVSDHLMPDMSIAEAHGHLVATADGNPALRLFGMSCAKRPAMAD